MLNGWKEIILNDHCERITVGHVGSMANQYKPNGIPFLRSLNINPFRLNLKDLVFIDEDFNKKLKKSELKAGDLVLVRTGYPGTACVIPENLNVANCSDLVIIRPSKNLDPYFVAAVFNSSWGKQSVGGSTVGAAQQHFNIATAKALKFLVPEYSIQKRIGLVVRNLSDLIEINNESIKLLEETARELYKEWFVRMRFPGYKKAKFVKGVPEGWEVKKVDDLADVTSSKRIFLSDYVTEGVPFYRGKEISLKSNNESLNDLLYISLTKFKEIKKRFGSPKVGDILITAVGTIGNIYLVNDSDGDFYFKDGNLIWVRDFDNLKLSLYFYFYSISDIFSNALDSNTIGSSQEALTIASLKKIQLILPAKELIDSFYEIANPIKNQIETLQQQNTQLRQIRDRLLPRLVSGKLAVKMPKQYEENDALSMAAEP